MADSPWSILNPPEPNFTGYYNNYYYQNGQLQTTPPAGGQTTPQNTTTNTTQTTNTPPATTTPSTTTPTTTSNIQGAQIVPGQAQTANQINVADAAGQLVTDPGVIFNDEMQLSNNLPTISEEDKQAGTIGNEAAQGDAGGLNQNAQTAQTAQANPNIPDENKQAAGVETKTTQEDVANNQMEAAQGQVSQNAQINPNDVTIDTEAVGRGETETGKALAEAATQNISNIIDTSTSAGKLLAEQLGEGNYTDAKATLKGQIDILSKEFVDPTTGEPTIPAWAAATARNVSRIAAFKGMSGTAAVAAMSQALLEASIPIAQADAQFFQTLTIKNLDNRQEATINRANVLAKMDLANMDARMQAAVTNSQAFLAMDLKNLDNEQQAAVINNQARIQSILEDAKTENANRLFVAQSQNEKDMFYDNLSASIAQFNADQANTMAQFNTGQVNDMSQFNAQLENNREQFYKNMQFAIDTANAEWRQKITLTENAQAFEAASTDVKNKVGVSVEELNRLWDRADSLLDYIWKTADNEADRKNQLALVQLQGNINAQQQDSAGWGSVLGSVLGSGAQALFDWIF